MGESARTLPTYTANLDLKALPPFPRRGLPKTNPTKQEFTAIHFFHQQRLKSRLRNEQKACFFQ